MKKDKKVSDRAVAEFRLQCREGMVAMVTKLLSKSPLRYPLVPKLSCLDPKVILEEPEDAIKKFEGVVVLLLKARQLKSDEVGEKAVSQFQSFINSQRASLNNFDRSSDRIDVFYYNLLSPLNEYQLLWEVVQSLLVLSHGQASVERGFSVNKEVNFENQGCETVVAHRLICDAVSVYGSPAQVPLGDDLLKMVDSSRARYRSHLAAQKEQEEAKTKAKKRKHMEDDVREVRKKIKTVQATIEDLEKTEEVELRAAQNANRDGMAKHLAKGLAMRDARVEQSQCLKQLEETLKNIEKELRESL
jgi:hypothetical protein